MIRPHLVEIELTADCNLSCLHCYRSSKYSSSGGLSWDVINRLVHEMKALGVQLLDISGGEPLLSPYIFALVELSRKLNIMPIINTNGTLVTDSIVKDLRNCGARDIGVSIDSHDPKIHDKIRNQEGTFDKAIRAVELLKMGGLRVSLLCVINRLNIDTLHEYFEFAKNLGVFGVYFDYFHPVGIGSKNRDLLQLNNEDKKRLSGFIKELINNYKEWLVFYIDEAIMDNKRCSAGKTYFGVLHDGTVVPCTTLYQLTNLHLGNINHESFAKCINRASNLSSFNDLLCKLIHS